ncbi:MAG: hypothetical protein O7A62_11925, partial [Alphaproteobacteria bacterium]|nr:hypothetical protein [Alphaproteobacteria bacterium]
MALFYTDSMAPGSCGLADDQPAASSDGLTDRGVPWPLARDALSALNSGAADASFPNTQLWRTAS